MLFSDNQLKVLKYSFIPGAIGAVLYLLNANVNVENSGESILSLIHQTKYQWLGILAGCISLFVLFGWESFIAKNKKQVLILGLSGMAAYLLSLILQYYYPEKKIFIFIISIVLAPSIIFGLIRGWLNLGIYSIKAGIIGGLLLFIIGNINFYSSIQFSIVINKFVHIEFFTTQAYQFIYKLISPLFLYGTIYTLENVFIKSFAIKSIFKNTKPIKRADFIIVYIIAFYFFLNAYLTLVSKALQLSPPDNYLPNSIVFLVLLLWLVIYIMTAYLLVSVLAARLYTIGRSVTWTYILSFLPIINIIPFFILSKKDTAIIDENIELKKTWFPKSHKNFALVIIIIALVSHLYNLIMYFNSNAVIFDSESIRGLVICYHLLFIISIYLLSKSKLAIYLYYLSAFLMFVKSLNSDCDFEEATLLLFLQIISGLILSKALSPPDTIESTEIII